MKSQFTEDKKVLFEKDTLYFMTSNTPHETLYIDKGKRRTLLRLTLNHEYPNELLQCNSKLIAVEKNYATGCFCTRCGSHNLTRDIKCKVCDERLPH